MMTRAQAGERLMMQTEARDEARRLNQAGLPIGLAAVAHPVPIGSWGGSERGWSVSYVPVRAGRSKGDA